MNKIISSKSFIKGLSEKIKRNIDMLIKNRNAIIEERSKLSLIKIKEKEYSDFEKKIMPFLVEIGGQSLLKLESYSKI